jgi:hypothetical protein
VAPDGVELGTTLPEASMIRRFPAPSSLRQHMSQLPLQARPTLLL